MKEEYDTGSLIKNMEAYKKLLEKYNKKRKALSEDENANAKSSYDLKVIKKKMSTSEK